MPSVKILDLGYEFPADYHFVLDGKVRSVWYDQECARRNSSLLIAQELDIDFGGSSPKFYDTPGLLEILLASCRPPEFVGDLDILPESCEPLEFIERRNGPLKLWCKLIGGRPPRGRYGIGCDVSGGVEATNSTMSILNLDVGEKIGQYAVNTVKPGPYARIVVAVAKWISQEGFPNAVVIWETQGPGAMFRESLLETGWPGYYRQKEETKITKKVTQVAGYGGVGGRGQGKLTLHGNYHRNLAEGRFINRSREAVLELDQYETAPDGTPYHVGSDLEEDPRAKGENHGDLVVADALASKLLDELRPRRAPDEQPREYKYSFAGRRAARRREKEEESLW